MYEIELTRAARRDLENLPKEARKRVDAKIQLLARNPYPRGTKKLESNLFRVRVGDYRILYQIESQRIVITVIRIRHRRDVYRSL